MNPMKRTCFVLFLFCAGIMQAQNNAIQNALKNYDYETALKLIEKNRETPELNFLKATCFKNIGRYKDAIPILEELVREDVSNIRFVNELADCYQTTGNYQKAKLYYFAAWQSVPTNRFAQINYLNIVYKLNDWNQAIHLSLSILQKDTIAILFPMLGDCYAHLSKQDSAIIYYKKAMHSNPEDYNTLKNLSGIYLQKGKYTDMINSTNTFILKDSSNNTINRYNGIGHCMKKEFGHAIYRLNKLLQEGDSSFLTNYYLGAAYFATQNYILAYDRLNQAYRTDSSNIDLYFYLGKSAIYSGHQQKGIQILNAGLNKLIPNDTILFNYYYNISKAYNRLFNPTEEIKYLKLCFSCNQDYKLALYTIAEIYDDTMKDPEEALNYYTRFMATRPKTKASKGNNPQGASYYNVVENRMLEIKAALETTSKKRK